ncbi:low molecular weight protein-tyrosine-phosphatase [Neptunicella sp. SCSIO 80796]|uniref:low molecular weight protein-tyrosine-phosphatase n=1 Tax=Neptunicella plasticusilytica TaxID=3117012 RepID=UPI003A4E07B2
MRHYPAILFVCLGNICRSPSAHAVFRHKAKAEGLSITTDCAGTQGFHKNAKPDERAVSAGMTRGYNFDGLFARRVVAEDFEKFDLILAMDHANFAELTDACPEIYRHKIKMFLSFSDCDEEAVPDPYYGGAKGFEYVLDLIEDAADGLLEHIKAESR